MSYPVTARFVLTDKGLAALAQDEPKAVPYLSAITFEQSPTYEETPSRCVDLGASQTPTVKKGVLQ